MLFFKIFWNTFLLAWKNRGIAKNSPTSGWAMNLPVYTPKNQENKISELQNKVNSTEHNSSNLPNQYNLNLPVSNENFWTVFGPGIRKLVNGLAVIFTTTGLWSIYYFKDNIMDWIKNVFGIKREPDISSKVYDGINAWIPNWSSKTTGLADEISTRMLLNESIKLNNEFKKEVAERITNLELNMVTKTELTNAITSATTFVQKSGLTDRIGGMLIGVVAVFFANKLMNGCWDYFFPVVEPHNQIIGAINNSITQSNKNHLQIVENDNKANPIIVNSSFGITSLLAHFGITYNTIPAVLDEHENVIEAARLVINDPNPYVAPNNLDPLGAQQAALFAVGANLRVGGIFGNNDLNVPHRNALILHPNQNIQNNQEVNNIPGLWNFVPGTNIKQMIIPDSTIPKGVFIGNGLELIERGKCTSIELIQAAREAIENSSQASRWIKEQELGKEYYRKEGSGTQWFSNLWKKPWFISLLGLTASSIVPVGSLLVKGIITRIGTNMSGPAQGGASSSNNETHNHYYIGNGTNPTNANNQQVIPYAGTINENPMLDDTEKFTVVGTIFGIIWGTVKYALAKGPK